MDQQIIDILACLAHLEFSESDTSKLKSDLTRILEYCRRLKSVVESAGTLNNDCCPIVIDPLPYPETVCMPISILNLAPKTQHRLLIRLVH